MVEAVIEIKEAGWKMVTHGTSDDSKHSCKSYSKSSDLDDLDASASIQADYKPVVSNAASSKHKGMSQL